MTVDGNVVASMVGLTLITAGGVVSSGLATVTATEDEVVMLPAESRRCRRQLMLTIQAGRSVPSHGIRRHGVFGAQSRPIHQELHPRHTEIVGRTGANRHGARNELPRSPDW